MKDKKMNTDLIDNKEQKSFRYNQELEGDAELRQLENQGVDIEIKSKTSWSSIEQNKNYEDLINQTKELSVMSMFDIEEMRLLEEESKNRQVKIDLLEKKYQNLNSKPLSGVDLYDSYDLVLNKSAWNYNEILARNTAFTIQDLALQTQLYLYDGKILELKKIENTINKFINNVMRKISNGYAVLINPIIILDTVRFAKSNIMPITVANPKLMSPINLIEWDSFVIGEDELKIIDTFNIILENALSNGHEVEFFKNSFIVRNIEGIHSLFINDQAAKMFNANISGEYIENSSSSTIKEQ